MYFIDYYVLHNTQFGLLIVRITMHSRTHAHARTLSHTRTTSVHTRTGLNRFVETNCFLSLKFHFFLKIVLSRAAYRCFVCVLHKIHGPWK